MVGPVGLGQVVAAAAAQPPRGPRPRARAAARRGRPRRATSLALRRRVVLVPQLPAPLADTVAGDVALRRARARTSPSLLERAGLDAVLRRPRDRAAVGRRAAARDARAGARARPRGPAARRADVGARRRRARRRRGDDRRACARGRPLDRRRHARPRAGRAPRRPRRCGSDEPGVADRRRRTSPRRSSLVAIAAAISRWRARRARARHRRSPSCARSCQLTAVGFVIEAIFESRLARVRRRCCSR